MKTFTTSILVMFTMIFASKATAQTVHVDKVKHFVAGAVIGNGAELLTYKITNNKTTSMLVGFGTGVAMDVAKEVYDRRSGRGVYDNGDILWTGIGSAVGTLSFSIIIPQNKPKGTVTYSH